MVRVCDSTKAYWLKATNSSTYPAQTYCLHAKHINMGDNCEIPSDSQLFHFCGNLDCIRTHLSDHLCHTPSCVPLRWSYCAAPPGYVHPVWQPSPAEPDPHRPTTACHLEKQMNYSFPKVTEPTGLTANRGTCHYHLFVSFIPHAYNPVVYCALFGAKMMLRNSVRVGERGGWRERVSEKSKEIELEHYACSLPSVSQWGRAQGSLATCPGWRQGLFIHKAIRVHLFSQCRCS